MVKLARFDTIFGVALPRPKANNVAFLLEGAQLLKPCQGMLGAGILDFFSHDEKVFIFVTELLASNGVAVAIASTLG